MADAVHTRRVFSGIKPSGGLTMGNYLGAIKRFVEMQSRDTLSIYCVVDLHAITVWQDPADLRYATRELVAAYIASGIAPEQSILERDSINGGCGCHCPVAIVVLGVHVVGVTGDALYT